MAVNRGQVTVAWHDRSGDVIAMSATTEPDTRIAVPDGAVAMSLVGVQVESDELSIMLAGDKPQRLGMRWP